MPCLEIPRQGTNATRKKFFTNPDSPKAKRRRKQRPEKGDQTHPVKKSQRPARKR